MKSKNQTTIISLIVIVIGITLAYFYILTPKEVSPPKPDTKDIPKLVISTDKTIYEKGGIVKISIENRLDKSIWYIKKICPPSCCNLFKWENSEWKNLGDPIPCIQLTPPPGVTYSIESDELKTDEVITKQWDIKLGGKYAKSGSYRFSFYYGLNKDDPTSKTTYSNEFSIE